MALLQCMRFNNSLALSMGFNNPLVLNLLDSTTSTEPMGFSLTLKGQFSNAARLPHYAHSMSKHEVPWTLHH